MLELGFVGELLDRPRAHLQLLDLGFNPLECLQVSIKNLGSLGNRLLPGIKGRCLIDGFHGCGQLEAEFGDAFLDLTCLVVHCLSFLVVCGPAAVGFGPEGSRKLLLDSVKEGFEFALLGHDIVQVLLQIGLASLQLADTLIEGDQTLSVLDDPSVPLTDLDGLALEFGHLGLQLFVPTSDNLFKCLVLQSRGECS